MEIENETEEKKQTETVQVIFTTKYKEYQVIETPFEIPVSLTRYGLSEVINHLLGKEKPIPFEFLINEEFLRTSLKQFLDEKNLSSEKQVTLEYVPALPQPKQFNQFLHDDWVSAVDGKNSFNIFATGCYDNLVRIWKSGLYKLKGNEIEEKKPIHVNLNQNQNQNQEQPSLILSHHSKPIKSVKWLKFNENISNQKYHLLLSASLDEQIILWKISSNLNSYSILTKFIGHSEGINDIALNPKRNLFCSCGNDSLCFIWDINDKKNEYQNQEENQEENQNENQNENKIIENNTPIASLRGHTQAVSAAIWPSQSSIYTTSYDYTIKKWDVEKQSLVWEAFSKNTIHCLHYNQYEYPYLNFESNQNQNQNQNQTRKESELLLTGHSDGIIRLWDNRIPSNSEESCVIKTLFKSHTSWISSLKWKPNSDFVFASGSYDGSVKIWDIRTKIPLFTLKRNSEKILDIDWLDSQNLLTASADQTVKQIILKISN
ncbi:ribosome biogenesis protein wdr12 [Anaeramoeba ignava]|uniref:Ribosome biogenesis protein WDR12 homolog n=1 Tax=Anaeramoeba ignava TaxID=1746090 RepID=A0A9Q0RCI4_ANAIG|nr:ribosome biogenesis protein wdr12 [Anaeramoeba ignava]